MPWTTAVSIFDLSLAGGLAKAEFTLTRKFWTEILPVETGLTVELSFEFDSFSSFKEFELERLSIKMLSPWGWKKDFGEICGDSVEKL